MRKRLKKKRRACRVKHPNKRAITHCWTPRDMQRLREFERERQHYRRY